MAEKLTWEYRDGRCVWSDGWSYPIAPRKPGQTYVDPFVYRASFFGEGLPKTTAADLATIPKKVDLAAHDPGRFDLRKG